MYVCNISRCNYKSIDISKMFSRKKYFKEKYTKASLESSTPIINTLLTQITLVLTTSCEQCRKWYQKLWKRYTMVRRLFQENAILNRTP